MPKEVETRDRFRIFAETSSEAMGPLLAQLTRMGLENIGYELITDVATFKDRKRVVHDVNARDFASQWIETHPTFTMKELQAYFKANDRAATTANYAVGQMVDDKIVVRLGVGNYRRADVQALAGPKSEGNVRTRVRGAVPKYDVPNFDVILKMMRNRKTITVASARELLIQEGRNGKSASPIISRMSSSGLLKQLAPGEYEVLDAAKEAAAALKMKPSTSGKVAHG